jgi:uncharacterized protein DUF222
MFEEPPEPPATVDVDVVAFGAWLAEVNEELPSGAEDWTDAFYAELASARPSDTRPSDTRPSDARPSDARPSDARASSARPSDARASDARASDAQVAAVEDWSGAAGGLASPAEAAATLASVLRHGPGVAAVAAISRLDHAGLTPAQQIDLLVAVEEQRRWLDEMQQRVLAAIARSDQSAAAWSSELVSCALRLPGLTAQRRLKAAQTLVEELPATLAALGRGELSLEHAQVIVEAAWRLPTDRAGALEEALLEQAADQTVATLRRRARRAVIALDPATAEERHRRAAADRSVRFIPAEDGMAELRALLPAEHATAVYTRLTGATGLLPASDPRSRDQQRADLLIDAVLTGLPADALPRRHGRQPTISVVIAASTLIGSDHQPGWLAGYGPITADTARRLAADPTGTWRRMITDPTTGNLLDYGTTTYRPPQNLADYLLARDPVCIFPGCNQPSYLCQVEHCRPFDQGGPTSPANTAPVCSRHHNAKTHGPFSYRHNPDGSYTWTDGHAHQYITHRPLRPAAAAPDQTGTGPPEADERPPF